METGDLHTTETNNTTPAPASLPQARTAATETTVTHRDIAEWHGKQFIDRNGEKIGNRMEADRLARVRINLSDEVVEISRHERDVLLEELCFVANCKPIRERFEVVGATRPVELSDVQRLSLRAVLTGWESDIALPEGIARLLAALERAVRVARTGEPAAGRGRYAADSSRHEPHAAADVRVAAL